MARFRELGHRPLTFEEVFELRLQFTDQPDVPEDNDLYSFSVLVDPDNPPSEGSLHLPLFYTKWSKGVIAGFFSSQDILSHVLFYPHSGDILGFDGNRQPELWREIAPRFACVIAEK